MWQPRSTLADSSGLGEALDGEVLGALVMVGDHRVAIDGPGQKVHLAIRKTGLWRVRHRVGYAA